MYKYVLRRLLVSIPVLLGITIIISSIIYLDPASPARVALGPGADPSAVAELERQMGLDQPPHLRYLEWLAGVIQGDLGNSLRSGEPVADMIADRIVPTLELVIASMVITLIIAIPLGVVSAVKQHTWVDNTAMLFALFWLSMPSFWLALVLLLLFAVHWSIFPISGRAGAALTLTWFAYIFLPAISNGARRSALLMRMTRSAMLNVLHKDYIRTARGKGVGKKAIIYTHAMKNAMIPVLTLIGLQVPTLFSASVIIEIVFSWPGMGRLLVNATLSRDYPVVQGLVLVYSLIVLASNFVVDLLYTYFDPRISYD
ncbi:ABC transporter permease [Natrialbaceae archaeon A-CW2]